MPKVDGEGGCMSRKIGIAAFLLLAGAAILLMEHESTASTDHMMGGGMMGGGMGGGMMGRTPANNGSLALPDQQSKQAQLYQHYCSQCHALPYPRAHTSQEWPSVVARMKQTMASQGKTLPDNDQLEEVLGYLQRYAKRPTLKIVNGPVGYLGNIKEKVDTPLLIPRRKSVNDGYGSRLCENSKFFPLILKNHHLLGIKLGN
jgi:hypothetical protein